MFQKGMEVKPFNDKLLEKAVYSSSITRKEDSIVIEIKKDGGSNDKA